jgi:uncharacterized RDD family membrane protein YckC
MTTTPPPPVSWQDPGQTQGPAAGVAFAPHGERLIAYILDSLIVGAVVLVLLLIGTAVLLSGATFVDNQVTSVTPGAAIVFSITVIVSIVLALLYFPYFWARGGQTLGMRPFQLRVVRDSDGGSIGWGTAFLRLVGLWVAGAVFYIGYIWIFIDKRRRGWQDLIAGTVVIKQP